MTDPIDEIRTLLGPIDPAWGRPAPRLESDTILRGILDSAPSAPSSESGPRECAPVARDRLPGKSIGSSARRRQSRHLALVSCLAVLAVVVGAVTLRLNSSHGKAQQVAVAGRTVADRGGTQREAPSGPRSPDVARLLPQASASIGRLVTYDMPVDSTYQQLFVGTRTVNPPQLLVSTIDVSEHRSGSRLLSESLPRSHQTAQVGSHRVALHSREGRIYLWWREPDGVEVDITATKLTTSEVVHALMHADVSHTSRLGLEIVGVLPAGLHLVSSVFTNQPGMPVEELEYRQGTCDAQLEVFSNVDGDTGPASGTTRWTILAGHQALITTDHDIVTLVWAPVQGFTAQISASTQPACDVTALVQQVHRVTTSQWAATFMQLGAKAQHLPAGPKFR